MMLGLASDLNPEQNLAAKQHSLDHAHKWSSIRFSRLPSLSSERLSTTLIIHFGLAGHSTAWATRFFATAVRELARARTIQKMRQTKSACIGRQVVHHCSNCGGRRRADGDLWYFNGKKVEPNAAKNGNKINQRNFSDGQAPALELASAPNRSPNPQLPNESMDSCTDNFNQCPFKEGDWIST